MYIEENNINIDNIKSLSNEIEVEVIDVKAIYDRLNLISKNDWTKIFDNLELLNLKSVQKSISKNEIVKEINIVNALKSIKKITKFGLNY